MTKFTAFCAFIAALSFTVVSLAFSTNLFERTMTVGLFIAILVVLEALLLLEKWTEDRRYDWDEWEDVR